MFLGGGENENLLDLQTQCNPCKLIYKWATFHPLSIPCLSFKEYATDSKSMEKRKQLDMQSLRCHRQEQKPQSLIQTDCVATCC